MKFELKKNPIVIFITDEKTMMIHIVMSCNPSGKWLNYMYHLCGRRRRQ